MCKSHIFNMRIYKHLLSKLTFRLLLLFIFLLGNSTAYIKFDRQNTGVLFSPYVKYEEDNGLFNFSSYLFEDIKTMLKIVSTKFTKIYTVGFSLPDNYTTNGTHGTVCTDICTARAAALINKEKNLTMLEIYAGINMYHSTDKTVNEIQFTHQANKLFPGTVPGFILSFSETLLDTPMAYETLNIVTKIRTYTNHIGVKLGIRLTPCVDLCNDVDISTENNTTFVKLSTLSQVDFILFSVLPTNLIYGPEYRFEDFENALLKIRQKINKLSPNLEVMGETCWPSGGSQQWENFENMQLYWNLVNRFATQHNYMMWLNEAIDNPWRATVSKAAPSLAHLGWWKLGRYSNASQIEGYTEKNLERCPNFHSNFTGVWYSPFVRRRAVGELYYFTSISLIHIKTMLEVVSTKFSRIVTGFGLIHGDFDHYEPNSTIYKAFSSIFTAEAAALINKERNKTSLTVYILIYVHAAKNTTRTETQLSLEAAKKANHIYPSTALGVLIRAPDLLTNKLKADQVFDEIRFIKTYNRLTNLKIGVQFLEIFPFIAILEDLYEANVNTVMHSILNECDFVILSFISENRSKGPELGFKELTTELLQIRHAVNEMFPNIEIMGSTRWPNADSTLESWRNIYNMRRYWQLVNDFAAEYNFPVWLEEAFDNPWRNLNSSHFGWWRLADDSKLDKRESYIEDLTGQPSSEYIQCDQDQQTAKDKTPATTKHTFPLKDNETDNLWIYIGCGIGVFFLISVLILVIMRLTQKIQRYKNILTTEEVQEFLSGTGEIINESHQLEEMNPTDSVTRNPYDQSYEIQREDLDIDYGTPLGIGQFGCVFKATIRNIDESKIVALKMVKPGCDRSTLKGFMSEIKILIYLGKHENIVSIEGAYTAELISGKVYIATEFCSLGSLVKYLRKSHFRHDANYENELSIDRQDTSQDESDTAKPAVTTVDMLRWSYQIACGMEFIGKKHVVHADLATRNVLLTSNKIAKVSDFGLSRRMYNYTNYVKSQQEPLPWRWMSIESLKHMEFSSSSDVWSYGVTLWEIFSKGDVPYPGLSWTSGFIDNLMKGMRMKSPQYASLHIYNIMVDCWNTEPNARPKFENLKTSMENLLGI